MTETTTLPLPLISVIIPVYNGEKYLKETIESVIEQTEKNWEIIAINDGSKDRSLKILQMFEKTIPDRIRVFSVENGGVSRARNIGADLARGIYLAFLDQDDLWVPHKLEYQIALFLKDRSLGISFTNQSLIDEHGKMIEDRHLILDHRHRGYVFEQLLFGDFIPISTVIISRDIFLKIGGFDPQFAIAEDFDFLLKVTRYYPIDYIDEPLVLYRQHKESGSFTRKDQQQKEAYIIFNKSKKMSPPLCRKNLRPQLVNKVKVFYLEIKWRLGISHWEIFPHQ